MPELPEVETVKKALEKVLIHHKIVATNTYIDKMRYSVDSLHDVKLNSEIIAFRRRGRYIIVELDSNQCYIIHLGMSGSMRVVVDNEPRKKHEHVLISLDNGMSWRFDCPRRFGFMVLEQLHERGNEPLILAKLGIEPFDEKFTGGYLYKKIHKRKVKIKTLLMDNSIVVGVGNIYVNEVLFQCQISPYRTADSISKKECELLVKNIKEILARAIEAGGTTIADFKGVDGEEGKFVQELLVYGKHGENCPVCRNEIIKEVIGSRSAFYCKKCQK
ncbi:bifunctional DNA-formamidopyrimidine glycosylase/DNA-(apurinic or apyrimidinic site) lyase [Lentisphaerota bacterium WC36G]|nr:bifunctional DNA-formamidopyrimidine glycosylase/DNA-(apurinic or apyrimidinic site) lyase [Lentisphaerae bacterium WC36]